MLIHYLAMELTMKLILTTIAFSFVAAAAHANLPMLNATCPGGIEVHADQGGPVYINGKEAKLKKYNNSSFDAAHGGTTVSNTINPDKSAMVMYTGKDGANGICKVKHHHAVETCPADVSEADRANYPACN
jgi:hypothetical protein